MGFSDLNLSKVFVNQKQFIPDRIRGTIKNRFYLLSIFVLGILILQFYARIYLEHLSLTLISIFWILFNCWALFSDFSLSFSKNSLNEVFSQIKLDQIQTYMAKIPINSIRPTHFEDSNFSPKEVLKEGNLFLMENTISERFTGVMGFTLIGTALHVKPNLNDFFRKLYSMQASVPISIQIHYKDQIICPNSVSENIYGDSLFTHQQFCEPILNTQKVFQYQILFSQTENRLTRENLVSLILKLREIHLDLKSIIQTNFAHFHFNPLIGSELIDAIRGSLIGKSCSIEPENLVLDQNSLKNEKQKFLKRKNIKLLIPILLALILNIGILFYFGLKLLSYSKLCLLLGILGIISSILYLVKKIGSQSFISNWAREFQLLPLNIFPKIDLLIDFEFSKDQLLYFYNFNDEVINCAKFYSLGQFSRSFIFNPIKFYRELMYRFDQSDFSVSLQWNLQRVVPSELSKFKKFLQPKFMTYWIENPSKHDSFARNTCGFFIFQPILAVSLKQDIILSEITSYSLYSFSQRIDEIILPIINDHMPQCGCTSLKQNALVGFLSKNRFLSQFGTKNPLHFVSGLDLAKWCEIPDEIHKSLSTYYPGEFSAPLLADEISFGSTFNPENCNFETIGGLQYEDLSRNILLVGEHYSEFHKSTMSMVASFMKHKIPMIIFDWDGTWRHFDGMLKLKHQHANLEIYHVGSNLGLSLFQLPFKINDARLYKYISALLGVFQLIFDWDDKELSLLRNAWLAAGNNPINELLTKFGDPNDEKKSKLITPIKTMLELWQKDFLNSIFNQPIERSLPIDSFFDERKTILISVEGLKDTQFKSLFIQAFLLQIFTLFESDDLELPKKNLKCVVLPELNKIFPSKKRNLDLVTIDSLLEKLQFHNFPIIAESSHISDVYPSLLNYFETKFVFRCQNRENLSKLASYLNLDNVFTNIFSNSSRKASYQREFLMGLDKDKALVFRPLYQLPYVFAFDLSYFISDVFQNYNRIKFSNLKLNFAPASRYSIHKDANSIDIPLLPDLEYSSKIIKKILTFLQTLNPEGEYPEMTLKASLLEILTSEISLHDLNHDIVDYNRLAAEILEDLIFHQYFTINTKNIKDSNDITYYQLSHSAKNQINSITNYQKITQFSLEVDEISENQDSYIGELTESELNDSNEIDLNGDASIFSEFQNDMNIFNENSHPSQNILINSLDLDIHNDEFPLYQVSNNKNNEKNIKKLPINEDFPNNLDEIPDIHYIDDDEDWVESEPNSPFLQLKPDKQNEIRDFFLEYSYPSWVNVLRNTTLPIIEAYECELKIGDNIRAYEIILEGWKKLMIMIPNNSDLFAIELRKHFKTVEKILNKIDLTYDLARIDSILSSSIKEAVSAIPE